MLESIEEKKNDKELNGGKRPWNVIGFYFLPTCNVGM